jgi:hypothetical protein
LVGAVIEVAARLVGKFIAEDRLFNSQSHTTLSSDCKEEQA